MIATNVFISLQVGKAEKCRLFFFFLSKYDLDESDRGACSGDLVASQLEDMSSAESPKFDPPDRHQKQLNPLLEDEELY